ncbi:MAG: hypothetical protein LBC97_10650 [Bifidobacteriaceae bacterium]|nr:hypothetical protein [Bifidobacteriaceae bacterium]
MRSYLDALRTKGAKRFVVAGLMVRFPAAMVGIGITMMISGLYGEYALAGVVTAAHTIAFAVGAPIVGRLIDRFGQASVGYPLIAVFVVAAAGLTIVARLSGPWPALVACATVTGFTSFPVGALTRSRWSHLLLGGKAATPARRDRLQTAFALESVLDEVAWIFAPTFTTVCATMAWPVMGVRPEAGVVALIALMAFAGPLFLSARGSEPPTRRHEHSGSAIRSRGVWVVAVVFVGVGLLFGANNITLVAMCESLGNKALAGPVGAAGSFAALCGALWYGSRRWRAPLHRRFVIGLFALTGAAVLFLAARDYWSIAVVSFCFGLAIGPTFVGGNALIESLVPRENLTEGLTWIGTAVGVGMAAGAAVAGRVVDGHGAHSGYWVVCAGAIAAMGVATFSGARLSRRHAPAPRPEPSPCGRQ